MLNVKSMIPWRKTTPVVRENGDLLDLSRGFDRVLDDFFRSFAAPWGLTPFFGETAGPGGTVGFTPCVDVTVDEREVRVSAELPGLDEKEVDVRLSDDVLTLRGERRREEKHEDEGWSHVERSYGTFERTIPLPCEVVADRAEASFDKGVLTVRLPKSERAKETSRRIPIRGA